MYHPSIHALTIPPTYHPSIHLSTPSIHSCLFGCFLPSTHIYIYLLTHLSTHPLTHSPTIHPPTHPSTHLFPLVNCHPSSPHPSSLFPILPSNHPPSIIHQSIYLPSIHSRLPLFSFLLPIHLPTHPSFHPSIHPLITSFISLQGTFAALHNLGRADRFLSLGLFSQGWMDGWVDGWMDGWMHLDLPLGSWPSLETPFLAPACSSLLLLFLLCTPYRYMPASH